MARQKWATTTPIDSTYKEHSSEEAAYAWIRDRALQLREGELQFTSVKLWLDEGRGWELWEEEDLRKEYWRY